MASVDDKLVAICAPPTTRRPTTRPLSSAISTRPGMSCVSFRCNSSPVDCGSSSNRSLRPACSERRMASSNTSLTLVSTRLSATRMVRSVCVRTPDFKPASTSRIATVEAPSTGNSAAMDNISASLWRRRR
jgi:hypothetical protein